MGLTGGRRLWRLGFVALIASVWTLAAPNPVLSATTYPITIVYEGTCEGTVRGELRVDGGTVQLWLPESQHSAVEHQADAIREPDDTFRFDFSTPDGSFVMSGRLDGSAVSGSGSYEGLGSSCPLRFTGSTTQADEGVVQPVPPGGSKPEEREVELDPLSSDGVTRDEARTLLRRSGLSSREIDAFLEFPEWRERAGSISAEYERVAFTVALARGLVNLKDEDGVGLFPTLHALHQRPECDGCLSPMEQLAHTAIDNATAADAVNRVIRLAISLDLEQ